MIKKISAVVLALVLCLGVVALPASAAGLDGYVFNEGEAVALKVELDKEYYNAGDTAVVSVYLKVADSATELKSSYLTFGVSSAVIDTTTGVPNASAQACDAWEAYWVSPTDSSVWAIVSNATILSKLNTDKPADEEFMDTYYRINLKQDANKVTNTKHGVAVTDIDASAPLFTFELTIKDDVADGTAVSIGIPSNSITATPVQTSVTYFTNPGGATTGKAYTAAQTANAGVAIATIGAADPGYVSHWKNQIRCAGITNVGGTPTGTYNDTVGMDIRACALLDLAGIYGDTDTEDYAMADENIRFGFVYAPKGTLNLADAKTFVEANGTGNDSLTYYECTYLQRVDTDDDGVNDSYQFTCLVTGIKDATGAEDCDFIGFAYANGQYSYYTAVETISVATLISANGLSSFVGA